MISSKEWEARENARILAEAAKIRRNPIKLRGAKDAVRSIKRVRKDIVDEVIRTRYLRKTVDMNGGKGGQNFNVFKKI